MNKKIAKKWVKALRSGKYKKTTGLLCNTAENGNKSYCCLGVLTDLYNKEHPLNKQHMWGKTDLTHNVQIWAEMKRCDGGIDGFGHYRGKSLANLNDCKRSKRSFKRIADIIEKNVENL